MTANKKKKGIIIIVVCSVLVASAGILLKKFVFTKKIMQERVEVMILVGTSQEFHTSMHSAGKYVSTCFYPRY